MKMTKFCLLQMRKKLRQLDEFIFELMQRLSFEDLDNRVDIIILSDHGMDSGKFYDSKWVIFERLSIFQN